MQICDLLKSSRALSDLPVSEYCIGAWAILGAAAWHIRFVYNQQNILRLPEVVSKEIQRNMHLSFYERFHMTPNRNPIALNNAITFENLFP